MIPVTTAWAMAVALILIVWAVVLRRSGPWVALGVAVILGFLFPVWVEMEVAGLPIDVRTMVAIVALIGFGLHPDKRIWSPLTLPDMAIAGLVIIQSASDLMHDGFSPIIPLRAYGEWALPYVAARYAVRDEYELRKIAPWAIGVLAAMGLAITLEVVLQINVWETVFAHAADDTIPRLGRRFGLLRSTGTAINPIFCAMILFPLLAWPAVRFDEPESGWGRWWAAAAALLGVCGIFATISRGPIGGLLVAVAIVLMIRVRRLRWVIGGLLVAAAIVVAIWPKEFLEYSRLGIRDQTRRTATVELDGEELEYSGTLTRLLLFRAYSKPLRKAGLLGYGTAAVSEFPPNIPYLPADSRAMHLMRHVDNAYVLYGLRFGWLGTSCFAFLMLGTVWSAVVLSRSESLTNVSTWLAGIIAATSVVLVTVYFANDFGFVVLWTCGIVGGLASYAVETRALRHAVE